jgi:hypothetical protein
MKALTVRQPHAQLIALGVKTIETRSWATKYRGPLLIHAGKAAPNYEGLALGISSTFKLDGSEDTFCLWLHSDRNKTIPLPLPLGAIIASCKLVDCVPIVRDIHHAYENETDPKKALTYALPFVVPEFNQFNPGEREPHAGKTLIRVTYRPAGDDRRHTNYWDQLPYGDFTPGRFAWLLEDIKPTTERCPWCWGAGTLASVGEQVRGVLAAMPFGPQGTGVPACPMCKGKRGCDPIPAKGKQGLWEVRL